MAGSLGRLSDGILQSRDVRALLQQSGKRRAEALEELVRIFREEPSRLRLKRSSYTKIIKALGTGKRA